MYSPTDTEKSSNPLRCNGLKDSKNLQHFCNTGIKKGRILPQITANPADAHFQFQDAKNLPKPCGSRRLDGGRYRTRTCDPLHVNRDLKLFIIISVRFWSFCSVPFAFQYFLSLSFPHIPRRSVAVCVVKHLYIVIKAMMDKSCRHILLLRTAGLIWHCQPNGSTLH